MIVDRNNVALKIGAEVKDNRGGGCSCGTLREHAHRTRPAICTVAVADIPGNIDARAIVDGFTNDLRAFQRVFVPDTVYNLHRADAIGIVLIRNGRATFAIRCQLTPVPSKGSAVVGQRISNGVVRDGLAIGRNIFIRIEESPLLGLTI